MRVRRLHEWNLSYAQARELQTRLASEVRFDRLDREPELVAGLDCGFSRDGTRVLAAIVVLRISGRQKGSGALHLAPAETVTASMELDFPYIPGLLSLREAPVCLAAVRKLTCRPNVFLIDGQGFAHPRRLGLASHLGLFLDKPTVGCAKSRLLGTFEEPGREKGIYSLLRDGSEVIGAVVRTRRDVKPLFVSVGHRCRLDDAVRLTLACATKYRLPEPTRLAHQAVTRLKKCLG
ncbi:MAG: endonuclease V [Sedimentisphaerales bacterium]|nr:endonuclease V [Sedimentisphaerales bacterium]